MPAFKKVTSRLSFLLKM